MHPTNDCHECQKTRSINQFSFQNLVRHFYHASTKKNSHNNHAPKSSRPIHVHVQIIDQIADKNSHSFRNILCLHPETIKPVARNIVMNDSDYLSSIFHPPSFLDNLS